MKNVYKNYAILHMVKKLRNDTKIVVNELENSRVGIKKVIHSTHKTFFKIQRGPRAKNLKNKVPSVSVILHFFSKIIF